MQVIHVIIHLKLQKARGREGERAREREEGRGDLERKRKSREETPRRGREITARPTQDELIFLRVVQYFSQFHHIRVVQLLKDGNLTMYVVQRALHLHAPHSTTHSASLGVFAKFWSGTHWGRGEEKSEGEGKREGGREGGEGGEGEQKGKEKERERGEHMKHEVTISHTHTHTQTYKERLVPRDLLLDMVW